MHNRRIPIPIFVVVILVLVGAWYLTRPTKAVETSVLQGSGTVEVVEIIAAPETVGRVSEVLVAEGDRVQAGDPLFRLDDALLRAQRKQAETALASAQAGLEVSQSSLAVAQSGLETASIQYELEVNAARLQAQPGRITAWEADAPTEFEMPIWYFTRAEELSAAQEEIDAAKAAMDSEQGNFDQAIADAGSTELAEAEARLAGTEAAFLIANDVLDRASTLNDQVLRDYAQSSYDSALAELEAAQQDYDRLLDDESATNVLEARARLVVAKERYETALDRYNSLLIAEDSLRVRAAQASLMQAEANVAQAEARIIQAETAIDQAKAQLDLIDVQMSKLVIYAAVPGVILSRDVEPGEIVQPGSVAMTIGQLDDLTITVYIPEDRYGEINLGQTALVTVDSFPGQTFNASVIRIADQAEFTPRNVQTDEGRRTMVFAVKISVSDPDGKLKPGMPADVNFGKP